MRPPILDERLACVVALVDALPNRPIAFQGTTSELVSSLKTQAVRLGLPGSIWSKPMLGPSMEAITADLLHRGIDWHASKQGVAGATTYTLNKQPTFLPIEDSTPAPELAPLPLVRIKGHVCITIKGIPVQGTVSDITAILKGLIN